MVWDLPANREKREAKWPSYRTGTPCRQRDRGFGLASPDRVLPVAVRFNGNDTSQTVSRFPGRPRTTRCQCCRGVHESEKEQGAVSGLRPAADGLPQSPPTRCGPHVAVGAKVATFWLHRHMREGFRWSAAAIGKKQTENCTWPGAPFTGFSSAMPWPCRCTGITAGRRFFGTTGG